MFNQVDKKTALKILKHVRALLIRNINRKHPQRQFICISIDLSRIGDASDRGVMMGEIEYMLRPYASLEGWMLHHHFKRFRQATLRDMLTARLQWVEWMIEQVKARAD